MKRPRDPGEESEDRTEEEPLDEDVRGILRDLARSINTSLERSAGIGPAVKRLEALGFNVALYLEATLMLSRNEEATPQAGPRTTRRVARVRSGKLSLSDHDLKFLKSLKISLQEKETAGPTPAKRARPQRGGKKAP